MYIMKTLSDTRHKTLWLQAKVSEEWALRPSQEDARLMSDMQLLQQDYQLITMVHGEAIKQVSLQQY